MPKALTDPDNGAHQAKQVRLRVLVSTFLEEVRCAKCADKS